MDDGSYTVGGPPPKPGFFQPQNATDQEAIGIIGAGISALSNAAEFMVTGQTATQRSGLVVAPEPPRAPLPQVQAQTLPMYLADP